MSGHATLTMEEIECVVIGAGVVGLAVAAALGASGREVIVLERESAFGTGISSRNSEVIHAGLYYPPGSLKARLCVEGRERLYHYCRERDIRHARCGKLVVATSAEESERLNALHRRARENGVSDLKIIDGDAARALEPELYCKQALLSPSSGLVDSHALMLSLCGDIEATGGMIAFSSPCEGGDLCEDGGAALQIGGTEAMRLRARLVVNCAGLGAQAVARSLQLPEAQIPPLYFGKGNYFTVDKSFAQPPFSHLVYPLPGQHSLGAHLTCTLDGRVRLGPDLQWVDAPDYHVDPARAPDFEASVRRYWPDMPAGCLSPDYAGVRPKLSSKGDAPADFCIRAQAGVIHLFGIESPGLTSSLAIAEHVTARLQ